MPAETYITGRAIVHFIKTLVEFWSKHRATLAADMPTGVAAALDTLASALAAIEALNPEGPG